MPSVRTGTGLMWVTPFSLMIRRVVIDGVQEGHPQ